MINEKSKRYYYILPISFFMITMFVFSVFIIGNHKNGSLAGVIENQNEKPVVNYRNIMSGEFQSSYNSWFNLNFPFRDKFVRLYNQIFYSIMAESGNKNLVIGKNSSIYEIGQIERVLNPSNVEYGFDYYDNYAKNLKYIQDRFFDMGKVFFFIITPNKPEVMYEDIPLHRKLMEDADHSEISAHKLLKESLEKYGVFFYDTTETMTKIKNDKQDIILYPNTGTHWTFLAAVYAVKDVFDSLYSKTGIALPQPNVKVEKLKDVFYGEDIDVYLLLNIFKGNKDKFYYKLDIDYDIDNGYVKDNAVIFGTSYSNMISYIFQRDVALFGKLTYITYLSEIFDVSTDKKELLEILNNKIEEEYLISLINNNKYFFFEVQSTDLVPTHEQLVQQLCDIMRRDFSDKNVLNEIKRNNNIAKIDNSIDEFRINSENSNIKIDVKNKQMKVKNNSGKLSIQAKLTNNTKRLIKTNGKNIICAAYHIKKDGQYIEGRWSNLPNVIDIGETVDFYYDIDIPEKAGEYEVLLSIVQEKVSWLEEVNKDYPIVFKLIVE
ncbi:hypothetical protein HMPREF9630_00675 [Peptoanaerobacter stomatis]|uniref:AlgX/AlgJ SGNH hydrolase-like domain-containing protein n=1 Tax=Peptoanaerobacter stomatis TaxID=796937 RepID=V9HTW7_9FIRM|nr:hypothetical protein [Peptoanaerobacter stomatis]EHL15306.1 hypothetical protein HMPREF9630_00675 [Peptoanaerobacter stomatis]